MKSVLSKFTVAWPYIVVLAILGGLVFVLVTTPMFRVESGSMEPTLPVGSIVFEKQADTLKAGDIITFQQDGDDGPTTHTFIGYAEDGSLMTKGDANLTPDVHSTPLTKDEVLGKLVVFTPILAPSFWFGSRGLFVVCFIGAGALLLWWSTRKGKDAKKDEENVQSDTPSDASRAISPA